MPARRSLATLVPLAPLALVLALPACSLFEDDEGADEDDTELTVGSEEEDSDTDEPPSPPRQGFRVFPKYLLQDVPAIVTIEIEGEPTPCPIDVIEGGYLCDAEQAVGPLVPVEVVRDGFAIATRMPEIPVGLDLLDVHLFVEGGPTGTWSECVLAEDAALALDCTEICEVQMLGCAPASCATNDPENPVASIASFSDGACVEPLASTHEACDDPLPALGEGTLRCCCA